MMHNYSHKVYLPGFTLTDGVINNSIIRNNFGPGIEQGPLTLSLTLAIR